MVYSAHLFPFPAALASLLRYPVDCLADVVLVVGNSAQMASIVSFVFPEARICRALGKGGKSGRKLVFQFSRSFHRECFNAAMP